MSEGFREAMLELVPKLRLRARRLTGTTFDAEDLVQDTLVQAWRHQDQFRPGSNLLAWLSVILRNEYLDQMARRRVLFEDIDDSATGEITPPSEQDWRIRYIDLSEALGELNESARETLLLFAGQGMSYEETAWVTGCSVDAVKQRVRRARQRLWELMEPECEERPTAPSPRRRPH